jgi:hypothetical protein
MGLQLGLGFTALRASGGGPAPAAPVIVTPGSIDEQPLVGQAVLLTAPTFTGATSVSFALWDGDPDGSGALIVGATETYSPTATYYGDTLYAVWTATNAAGDTVASYAAPAVVGVQFREDFSGFTVGDDITDIIAAGWGRASETSNNTLWEAAIVSDATGPSGKAISFTTASSVSVMGYRSDIDAFFGANGHDTIQDHLFLIRHDTNSNRIALRGKMVAGTTSVALANLAAGLNVRINNPYLALPGEDFDAQPGAALTPAWTDDTYYFVRQRLDGAILRVKVWEYGDPEPASWITRTHGSVLTGRGPALGARWNGASRIVCYMAAGGNAPAPFWPGFIPPPDTFADLQTFAAPAPGAATVTAFGGTVVFNIEDMP